MSTRRRAATSRRSSHSPTGAGGGVGGGGRAIAIVVSRYNATITDRLLEGAMRTLRARRGPAAAVEMIDAPGSFELVSLSMAAAQSGRFEGVVALGCLIKGDTRHDRYIAQAVATGLIEVTLRTGVPVAFGVITAETAQQARDRAGGKKGNKGEEATGALLDTVEAMRALRRGALVVGNARPIPDKVKLKGAKSSNAKRKNT